MLMSETFTTAILRNPAMNANSIAATPRQSQRSCLEATRIGDQTNIAFVPFADSPLGSVSRGSTDQNAPAGHGASRHVDPGIRTASCGQDAASTIDENAVSHHHKAGLAIARFVDRTTERDVGVGQVDDAGDVPCRAVAGSRNIHAGGQFGVLVDRDARPRAGGGRRNVEGAPTRGRMSVAPPHGAREHDCESRAVGRLELVAVGIKLPILDDEDGARRGVDRDVVGQLQVAADEDVAAQWLDAAPCGGSWFLRIGGASMRRDIACETGIGIGGGSDAGILNHAAAVIRTDSVADIGAEIMAVACSARVRLDVTARQVRLRRPVRSDALYPTGAQG